MGKKVTIGGLDIAYDVHGSSGPWVTFSHSLGCTRHMWQGQIDALAGRFRVLTYDLRGHGNSGADATPGTLRLLAGDVGALLEHLGVVRSAFVGISIGGMIGQTLAIESPAVVERLVLANTTAFLPPPAQPMWAQRIQLARDKGVGSLARPSMERWFPAAFRQAEPQQIARFVEDFSRTSLRGYVACCEAIMGLDTRHGLPRIQCPTLIVGGSEDPGAPAEALQQMKQAIRGSELLILDGAGHLSNIDRPDAFNAALTRFLAYSVREPGGPAWQG